MAVAGDGGILNILDYQWYYHLIDLYIPVFSSLSIINDNPNAINANNMKVVSKYDCPIAYRWCMT